MLTENLLQFIWQYALFRGNELYLSDGRALSILHRGQRNTDSGPDFLSARIRIGDTIWAGNIELHIKSSDWVRHGHQHDAAYHNIILHVVYRIDDPADTGNFPVLELAPYIAPELLQKYQVLMDTRPKIACESRVTRVPDLIWEHWMERMLFEKWENKFAGWKALLERNNGDLADLFYQQLARTMGGKVNATAMQELAMRTPIGLLARHKNDLAHLEAILLGQAGLLPQEARHAYETELMVHYAFFRQKYGLVPMDARNWKFMRMRPAAFPTIRIAQLAMIIHLHEHLFSKLMKLERAEDMSIYFNLGVSEYWTEHYTFQKMSLKREKNTGQNLRQLIWINVVAPLSYFYASLYARDRMQSRAVELLRKCRPEQNNVIALWKEMGVKVADAAASQALLHLYNEYCSAKRCLNCSVGHWMLK